MIVRARTVVTMDRPPIDDGAVQVQGNRIVGVGRFRDIRAKDDVVDLGESVLLPGLINAHCHLDYTGLRGKIPPPRIFTDWIRAINAAKAKLNASDYLAAIGVGIDEALRFGTTTLVNFEAFPDLIGRYPRTSLRLWPCPELIDVAAPEHTDRILNNALQAIRSLDNPTGGYGLAPHALFTASPALFHGCVKSASRGKLLLSTHLAESAEEMEMFRCRSGPLFEFLQGFGRPSDDCGSATPFGRFSELITASSAPAKATPPSQNDDRQTGWIIVHLNELAETDFALMDRWSERISIVHCPRSHSYFGHRRFNFEKLSAQGLNICLGTDSLASNNDLSLFEEMRRFRQSHPDTPPADILAMVTLNSAIAIGSSHELGRICAGYLADMTALPVPGSTHVFETILNFADEVPWMMIDGKKVRER